MSNHDTYLNASALVKNPNIRAAIAIRTPRALPQHPQGKTFCVSHNKNSSRNTATVNKVLRHTTRIDRREVG